MPSNLLVDKFLLTQFYFQSSILLSLYRFIYKLGIFLGIAIQGVVDIGGSRAFTKQDLSISPYIDILADIAQSDLPEKTG